MYENKLPKVDCTNDSMMVALKLRQPSLRKTLTSSKTKAEREEIKKAISDYKKRVKMGLQGFDN